MGCATGKWQIGPSNTAELIHFYADVNSIPRFRAKAHPSYAARVVFVTYYLPINTLFCAINLSRCLKYSGIIGPSVSYVSVVAGEGEAARSRDRHN